MPPASPTSSSATTPTLRVDVRTDQTLGRAVTGGLIAGWSRLGNTYTIELPGAPRRVRHYSRAEAAAFADAVRAAERAAATQVEGPSGG